MLKLPAFKHYQFAGETVTVFQDDAQFWKFYPVPGFPTVRMDKNENPVFMLIKYNLSDESREENKDLPRGGGYMVFDSELKVSEEALKKVTEDLQKYSDEEWQRIQNLPDDSVKFLTMGATFNDTIGEHWKQPGMAGGAKATPTTGTTSTLQIPGPGDNTDLKALAGANKPTVVIGEPLYTSGKVTMNAPSTAALVTGKIGERTASLIGNNVAAFSLDLTTDGATFMEKTLVDADGTGGSDLVPIQVAYELTMLATLPPATMFVQFNTSSVYHACQELFHEQHNCTDDSFTSENMMTSAMESGLVDIKIDMGGITDPDIQKMLTQQAMSMTQELLTNKFADKEREPLEEWANSDVVDTSDEVYRLKRQTEVDMTNFAQRQEIRTTIEYKIAPQGTLQTFFKGKTEMSRFVRTVDLNDPFFKTLALKARAFAKWQEDSVAFVEMEVKYGRGSDMKTQTFTFTPQSTEPLEWDPSLIDGKREYEYRYRIAFVGKEPGEFTKWEKTTTRNLNVSVETPGKLDVEVTGVGLNFTDVLDAALVHLRYQDPAHDVPLIGQSILLSNDRPSGKWTRQIFAPLEKPLEYKVEYLLKSGNTLTVDWTKTNGPVNNVLIKRPDVDVLDLSLIPAGNWTDVIQSVLSLRYADKTYNRDAQFNFKASDEFKKWAVLLMNPAQRKFQYKILSTFKNGDVQETPWLDREGDQALPVTVIGPPRLTTKVSGAVLDYASTPMVKVDLDYADPEGQGDVESFSLQTATDVKTWSIPVRDTAPKKYRYKVTYFPKDGNPVERDWLPTDTELIVVPRYSIPKVGAEFSPVMQKFDLTPAIEVNLSYDNAQANIHERMTLVFLSKDKQSWFVPVPDSAPRAYDMTVTWYFNDGTQRSSKPVSLEKPAVVLPPPPAVAAFAGAGGV